MQLMPQPRMPPTDPFLGQFTMALLRSVKVLHYPQAESARRESDDGMLGQDVSRYLTRVMHRDIVKFFSRAT